MSHATFDSIPSTERLSHDNSVTRVPHTYFQELAEMGSLYEFLEAYMPEEFHENHEFRKRMLYLLVDNSDDLVGEVDRELLLDLQQSMQHFIARMQECNHPLH